MSNNTMTSFKDEQIGRGFALVLKQLRRDTLQCIQYDIVDLITEERFSQDLSAEEVEQIRSLHEAIVNEICGK